MLFNSFDFAIFLPIVYLLYWFVFNRKNVKIRNLFLLTVSYIFYGFWDWRFLGLILISSVMDYFLALIIARTPDAEHRRRKYLLIVSLVLNIGFLGFFKYYNFFVESFVATFAFFGKEFSYSPLNIILPVGISFYTFQSLSYTLDVYFKKMEPTHRLVNFLAFVSFFPQLVAGPIERARHLLPQFDSLKTFDYQSARSGLLLIVFGLFKKIVIADRIAIFVNQTYGDIGAAQGITLFVAVIFFAFQLYFDFSAYSDIAIGTARILGFNLTTNFRHPYLATSFTDFWKRWHITLSSWFRDYIYIPLGGNRKGGGRTILNLLIVFFLSGLWHGASWTFVIWGLLNALFLIVFDRIFQLEKRENRVFTRFLTVIFVSLCWAFSLVFFRAETMADALSFFGHLGFSNTETLYQQGLKRTEFNFSLILIAGLMLYEIIAERYENNLQNVFYAAKPIWRWAVYLILVLSIIYFGAYGSAADNAFIYFQF